MHDARSLLRFFLQDPHAALAYIPAGVVADHLWSAYSCQLLLAFHALAFAICLGSFLGQAAKYEAPAALTLLAAALHGTALLACISSSWRPSGSDVLGRKVACFCSLAAWGAANAVR
jgi:hypothetical protein